MNIEQLRHFTEIARCGSFNKAAEALYMTQSNLSHSIKSLEKELGAFVFVRSSTGISLTEFGEELLPYAKSVLSLIYQMPGNVFSKTSKSAPKLSVAGSGFKFISWILAQICDSHSLDGVHIDYHDVTRSETLSMVSSGTADIGCFSFYDFQRSYHMRILENMDVEYIPIAKVPVTVTVGRENPLFTRQEDWVSNDMIKNFPIIYNFSDYPTELQKQLGSARNKTVLNCNTRAGRSDLLAYSNCITIGSMPIVAYNKIDRFESTRVFKLKGIDMYNEMGYIKRKAIPLSPIAEEFAERFKWLFEE